MKFSGLALFYILALSLIQRISSDRLANLRCLICQQIVKDLQNELIKVDPKKKIEVGYRLDAQGNSNHNMIPYALSEMHISESLETVCKGIDDYVRATRKDTGELLLMKLIVDGKMNTLMSDVDIVQDGDLNKSLKYYCDGIVDAHEEDIVRLLQNKETDIEDKVCNQLSKLCGNSRIDRDDL